MATNLGGVVRAELLPLHDGNLEAAFQDLCERFAVLSVELDRSDRLRSYAFAREVPKSTGIIDDVPSPVTDDWIQTGKEGEDVGRG
jgi:hypothetical protein